MDANEISTDPIELQKQFDALNAPESDKKDEKQPEPEKEPAKAEPSDAATKQADSKVDQKEPEPEGVLARDGKHVIPYSVLTSARERQQEAEAKAAALAARVEELTQAAAQPKPAAESKGDAPKAEDANLTDEEIAAISDEFPAIGKLIKGFQGQITKLQSELDPVKAATQSAARERERSVAESVQDAIEGNPKLAEMQAKGGPAWESALAFDNVLKAQARWADKPIAERFAKVVALVEAELGTIEPPAKKEQAPLDAEALKRAAEKKAAESAGTGVPRSLSDLPSGAAPHVDQRSAIEEMTSQELAAKFGGMTPDQIDTFLFSQ